MDIIKIPIPAQRQQKIGFLINERLSVTIKEVADICGVSEATARRDLDDMAAKGLLERTHGGAVIHRGTGFEEHHSEKMKIMIPEKTRIAAAAANLLKDGDSILLDSGTSTYLLADMLHSFKHITVITNNMDIAYSAKLDSTSTMIVTGGIRREGYSILAGELTQNLIDTICVDYSFVGVDSINITSGIYCSNFIEIGVKKCMVNAGKKVVVLADSSKFHKESLAKLCSLDKIDIIITDDGLSDEERRVLEEQVERVIIA